MTNEQLIEQLMLHPPDTAVELVVDRTRADIRVVRAEPIGEREVVVIRG